MIARYGAPVNAYLAIAERVLSEARRPLSSREILRNAYANGFMSEHLYGATQHKTMGARLSEDILANGDRSRFFRSSPGRFFLTSFLGDHSIPVEHRTRFMARRRRRQLAQQRALVLTRGKIAPFQDETGQVDLTYVLGLMRNGQYRYAPSTKEIDRDDTLVWSFVVVVRDGHALTYRHGHYRERRDAFEKRRGLGFFSPVTEQDRTLFDMEDHGVVANGLRTVSMDLGFSKLELRSTESLARLKSFFLVEDGGKSALLSVIRFTAPNWFEPYARRLAINDLQWLDLNVPINHLEDFDPWSRAVLLGGFSGVEPDAEHGR